jgi:hypothetical protein
MKASIRDRLAFWLERFTVIHPLLFRRLAYRAPGNRALYENRINGHLITREDA